MKERSTPPAHQDFSSLLPARSDKALRLADTAFYTSGLMDPHLTEGLLVYAQGQPFRVESRRTTPDSKIANVVQVSSMSIGNEQKPSVTYVTTITFPPTQRRHDQEPVYGNEVLVTTEAYTQDDSPQHTTLQAEGSVYFDRKIDVPQTQVTAQNEGAAQAVIDQMELALQVAHEVAFTSPRPKQSTALTLTGLVESAHAIRKEDVSEWILPDKALFPSLKVIKYLKDHDREQATLDLPFVTDDGKKMTGQLTVEDGEKKGKFGSISVVLPPYESGEQAEVVIDYYGEYLTISRKEADSVAYDGPTIYYRYESTPDHEQTVVSGAGTATQRNKWIGEMAFALEIVSDIRTFFPILNQ